MLAVYIIWLRDLKRLSRERIRMLGMLGQPLLYLLVVGNGLGASVRLASAPPGFGYLEFIYPGVLAMSLLFTSIFSGMSVVWDREFGYWKQITVVPAPRWAIILGKALGGSTTATIQGLIILALAPVAKVSLDVWQVGAVVLLMMAISFMLSSLGLVVAARLTTMEGFQVIANFIILPIFFLSGALFPLRGLTGPLLYLMRLDPLTYGVDALRHVMYLGTPGRASLLQFPLAVDLAVVLVLSVVFFFVSVVTFRTTE